MEDKIKAFSLRHLKRQIHGRKDCTIYISRACQLEIAKQITREEYLDLMEELKARNIQLKVEEDQHGR